MYHKVSHMANEEKPRPKKKKTNKIKTDKETSKTGKSNGITESGIQVSCLRANTHVSNKNSIFVFFIGNSTVEHCLRRLSRFKDKFIGIFVENKQGLS